MRLFIYSNDKPIEDIIAADLVAVIDGVDCHDCELQADELYDSNDYWWSYTEALA